MRKKQRQSERLNNLMNKYKLTAEKEKKQQQQQQLQLQQQQQQQQQQQLVKNNSNKPVRLPQDKYTFTPEDFKYENKHYKYIKYTRYNKVSGMLGW
jgi:type II secretory pathway pseudopilin PulG